MQAEFINAQALTLQRRTQLTVAELDAVDHRAHGHLAGLQLAVPLRRGAGTRQVEAGVDGAPYAPTGRRQQRPDAHLWHLRAQAAFDGAIGCPLPAGAGAGQSGRHFHLCVARALAVPAKTRADGVTVALHNQAEFPNSGVNGVGRCAGCGRGAAVGLYAQVTVATGQRGAQRELFCQHHVPLAVEYQVTTQAR